VPSLYFDVASPYAYLALERADAAFGEEVAWPADWPANSLGPMRAVVCALRRPGDAGPAFARALCGRGFARGEDVATDASIAAAAVEAGLDPAAVAAHRAVLG